jgi:hypothetical protein
MLRPADSNACSSLDAQIRVVSKLDIASGKLTFIVDLPIRNGDVPIKNGIDIFFKTQCLSMFIPFRMINIG